MFNRKKGEHQKYHQGAKEYNPISSGMECSTGPFLPPVEPHNLLNQEVPQDKQFQSYPAGRGRLIKIKNTDWYRKKGQCGKKKDQVVLDFFPGKFHIIRPLTQEVLQPFQVQPGYKEKEVQTSQSEQLTF